MLIAALSGNFRKIAPMQDRAHGALIFLKHYSTPSAASVRKEIMATLLS
jgi:hypothetical protein